MRYNVAQLLKEQSGHTRRYTLHEDIGHLDADITPLSTLDGNIQFIRTADGILVVGSLHCSLELTCSRCLEPFTFPLQFTLEEEFRPTIDIVTGAYLPLPADADIATQIDARHTLDLTEVVRQNILLALPLNPICRTACKGLCPICGKNLNEGTCDCAHNEIDPRLQSLKRLLDE